LGGRNPNLFHFVLIGLYNFGLLQFFSKWPIIRINFPLEKRQFETAMHRVQFWRKCRPYNPAFEYIEAAVLYKKEQYTDAIEHLQKVVVECPDQGYVELVLTTLAVCYEKTKQFDKTIEAFAALTEVQPHRALGYGSLAEIYADDVPNPDRALEMINVSIEQLALNQKDSLHTIEFGAMLWAIRGWILQQLGEIEQTDDALQRAWSVPLDKKKSALASLQYRTGQVMLDRGDKSQAIGYFQQAVSTDPQSASGKLATKKLEELHAEYTSGD
jgi:tetratricopeptide (TPR) repeat protein